MSPLLLWLAGMLTRPTSAECRPGFYVNGVRPSGTTECIEAPRGNGADECVRGKPCTFADDAPRYPIAIVCAAGTAPRVIDARHVRCTQGGST